MNCGKYPQAIVTAWAFQYIGSVTQFSDVRFKEEISDIKYGLHDVMQLRSVTWKWKQKPEQGVQLGLIAQEVEKIVPELVSTDKDEDHKKGINYIGMVPVTIRAIQQQALIEDQMKRITEQQEQILQQQELSRNLAERFAALETLLSRKRESDTVHQ